MAATLRPSITAGLERNLSHVVGPGDAKAAAKRGIGSYARYWAEALRIPHLTDAQVDRRFTFTNYHHILDSKAAGFGPILVLPHLGQWEWAAAWLGRIDHSPVAAVVERLEPPEVFEWFTDLRESYDVSVIPLGPEAFPRLTKVVRDKQTVCLLADRDIQESGSPVSFFGAQTTLPSGPAVLSCRTGAPLLPVSVSYQGDYVHCQIGEPRWPAKAGKFRDRVHSATQDVAEDLEKLITQAPEQWHVLSPVWSS